MEIKISDVVIREDLYPRLQIDPATVQKYAEDLSVLPPIEINQYNILIDGKHRLTAHKKNEAETINAVVIETKSDNDLLALAIQKNAAHGLQLSQKDKKKMSIRLYADGTGTTKADISKILSISEKSVSRYVNDIDKRLREQRKEKIFDMYLACHTQQEIAEAVGLSRDQVQTQTEELCKIDNCLKSTKLSAQFSDFEPELYNVWTFAKKTNEVSHFGNSEQRIFENLLYAYTEPFDIVLDPFGGGGSTIDVCKKRLRRYFVSDRKPIPEREDIRKLDIISELPEFNKRWSDVTLTYLDPPYWKQAENKYSTDLEDLANQSIDDFNSNLSDIVKKIAEKQSKGHIALLIQPTQWNAPERRYTDHIFDLMKNIDLPVINRISCPYSTQQCTPQMVEWAKENKNFLVLSRELIIWSAER